MMVIDNESTIWCPLCRGKGSTETQSPCVGCGGSGIIAQVMLAEDTPC